MIQSASHVWSFPGTMGGYPLHRDGILAVSIHNSWGSPMDPQWDNGSEALRLRTRSTAQPVQRWDHPLKKQESICWGPPNQYGGTLKTFETMKPPTQLYIYIYQQQPPETPFFCGVYVFSQVGKHPQTFPYTMMPPGLSRSLAL